MEDFITAVGIIACCGTCVPICLDVVKICFVDAKLEVDL